MFSDNRRQRRALLCASATAMAILSIPSAFAQSEPQQGAQEGGIADIIVTANRRQENNQERRFSHLTAKQEAVFVLIVVQAEAWEGF